VGDATMESTATGTRLTGNVGVKSDTLTARYKTERNLLQGTAGRTL